MEVRGLGIVNITTLFGLKSIRHNKRLDLIVTLIPAKDQEELDRLGLEREGLDVLGEKVLHVQLSVAPGRDIARLVEVAAMDYHLKDMGIDMAGEFNRRLMSNFLRKLGLTKNSWKKTLISVLTVVATVITPYFKFHGHQGTHHHQ